jgi:hypothetical protein
MNFKEAFVWNQRNRKVLSPILKEKRDIENFRRQLIGISEGDEGSLKRKEILIDSGLLDVFLESIEYLPDGDFFVRKLGQEVAGIGLEWGYNSQAWNGVGITFFKNLDGVQIYYEKFKSGTQVDANASLYIDLNLEELKDKNIVAVAIADVIWKAGGKRPIRSRI